MLVSKVLQILNKIRVEKFKLNTNLQLEAKFSVEAHLDSTCNYQKLASLRVLLNTILENMDISQIINQGSIQYSRAVK
jgi:hypothetical protein